MIPNISKLEWTGVNNEFNNKQPIFNVDCYMQKMEYINRMVITIKNALIGMKNKE